MRINLAKLERRMPVDAPFSREPKDAPDWRPARIEASVGAPALRGLLYAIAMAAVFWCGLILLVFHFR